MHIWIWRVPIQVTRQFGEYKNLFGEYEIELTRQFGEYEFLLMSNPASPNFDIRRGIEFLFSF